MWARPDIHNDEFIALKEKCRELRIRLRAASSENDASLIGGDYAIYCSFSHQLLFSADTLKEISAFLRIGALYE